MALMSLYVEEELNFYYVESLHWACNDVKRAYSKSQIRC